MASAQAEGLDELLSQCSIDDPSTKSKLQAEGVRSLDDLLELPSEALTQLFHKASLPFLHEFRINQLIGSTKPVPRSPQTPEGRGPRRARNHVEAVRQEELKKLNIGRTVEDPYRGDGAQDEEPPLVFVARCGSQEQVELLLSCGANPNAVDQKERAALHVAAERGDTTMVRTLLAVGVTVDKEDINGRTALYLGAKVGAKEVVQQLLSAKANPNKPNLDENTALTAAAYRGHAEVVKLLAESKADLHHINRLGQDAMFWAKTREHEEAAAVLAALCAKAGGLS